MAHSASPGPPPPVTSPSPLAVGGGSCAGRTGGGGTTGTVGAWGGVTIRLVGVGRCGTIGWLEWEEVVPLFHIVYIDL